MTTRTCFMEGYEPLTVKLTTILNNKAGIGWTSYSAPGVRCRHPPSGLGPKCSTAITIKPTFTLK